MRPGSWLVSESAAAVAFAILATVALLAPAGAVRLAVLLLAVAALMAPVAAVATRIRAASTSRATTTTMPVLTAVVEPTADMTVG